MRGLIRAVVINSISIFVTSFILTGLTVSGGISNLLIAGLLLTIFSTILDPIVKVITLPFNILTLGLLSFLTTLAALFAVTLVAPYVNVSPFTFNGFSFLGASIGQIRFSTLLSFVVISATIYFLNKIINWLFETR